MLMAGIRSYETIAIRRGPGLLACWRVEVLKIQVILIRSLVLWICLALELCFCIGFGVRMRENCVEICVDLAVEVSNDLE
jgi:hypothetical protein